MLPTPRTNKEKLLKALVEGTSEKVTPTDNIEHYLKALLGVGIGGGTGGGGDVPTDVTSRLEALEQIIFGDSELIPKQYKVLIITSEVGNTAPLNVQTQLTRFGHTATIVAESSFSTSSITGHDLVLLTRFNSTSYHAELKNYCYANSVPILIGYAQEGGISITSTFGLGTSTYSSNQVATSVNVINNSHLITRKYTMGQTLSMSASSDFVQPQSDLLGIPLLMNVALNKPSAWIFEVSYERPIRIAYFDAVYRGLTNEAGYIMDRMIRYLKFETKYLEKII